MNGFSQAEYYKVPTVNRAASLLRWRKMSANHETGVFP